MVLATAFLIIIITLYTISSTKKEAKNNWNIPKENFPNSWKAILTKKVAFYNALTPQEKELFEYKVHEFLLNCSIIGVDTNVVITDKLLIASSAIIPIFNFPKWKYPNIVEVILYPDMFNEDFETSGNNHRRILGMVGNGYMEGKMILSKPALHHGFSNESDKKNTAIHEFVHLIDKLDGNIDGIPKVLLEKQYTIPWIDLMTQKIDEIYDKTSDINPYGGTNRAEFFSVVSEYFFERPKLLARKHPDLYLLLEKIFKQEMDEMKLHTIKAEISRNDPCPCNSGIKFKKCCALN
ncbi:phenylalanyl-tRNA synthetase subunit alpha [Tenacibaculum holothuriorum]|uniref:Phenylalanyl-tRNA synthetase subunit alpha n=1 Tax=Tenacibaculum holothuriorum TaxID=1635173 RepID=A0A1Y2PC71_9FLAO|nr:zinc-dependent peptidase [Tenacibaculum holothuriorum]OSY87611.1 phenylalanyl-tRNA synthetase subunit alpha [Tenacibaculum holothuriorum]